MSRWKPKYGDRYFLVSGGGYVSFSYWTNSEVDQDFYEFGNVFRTKEEAEQALEKVKQALAEYQEEIEQWLKK